MNNKFSETYGQDLSVHVYGRLIIIKCVEMLSPWYQLDVYLNNYDLHGYHAEAYKGHITSLVYMAYLSSLINYSTAHTKCLGIYKYYIVKVCKYYFVYHNEHEKYKSYQPWMLLTQVSDEALQKLDKGIWTY